MLKKFCIFTVLLVILTTLFGCSAPASNTAGTSPSTEGAKNEKIVLKGLMEQVPDSDIVLKMVEDYTAKNPNVEIDIELLPYDQIRDKLVSSFLAPKSDYDIIVVDNPWMYDFASAGYLVPLNQKIEQAGNDYNYEDFSKPLTKIATVKDETYGIPFYNYALGLIYRKDVLANNNLTLPESLEQLQEVSKKLTKDGSYGIAMQPQKGYKVFEEWANWLFAAGGEIQDEQGNVKLDSPEAREALNKYIETFKNSAPPNSANWAFDESMRSMSSGESNMSVMYNWMLPTMNSKDGPAGKLAGNYGLAKMPGGKAVLGAWYWSIPTKSANVDEVWKFVSWITSKEQENNRVIKGGAPVRNSVLENSQVWEKGFGKEYYTTVKELLGNSAPLADGPSAEEMIQAVGTELNSAITGQKSVDQAIADAAKQAKEIMGK